MGCAGPSLLKWSEERDSNPCEVNAKAFKIKAHQSDFLFPNIPGYP